MSAPKLTPCSARAPLGALRLPLLACLGLALHALPAQAQTNPTGVMSFPATNVQVEIDNVVKKQSDRLFINKQQCLGPVLYEVANAAATGGGTETGLDAGADASTGTASDAGGDAGASSDAGSDASAAAFIAQPKAAGDTVDTDDSAPITITITNLGTIAPGANVLEFWMGMSGQDCFAPAGRQTVMPNNPPCKRIDGVVRSIDTKKQVLNFKARQLFTDPYKTRPDGVAPEDPSLFCNLQGPWSLFIVPLKNDTPSSGTPDMPIASTLKINFEPDFQPLPALSSVRGGRGETMVTVSWDMANGADNLTKYNVYFDKAAKTSSAGDCKSSVLVPGKYLPLDTAQHDGQTSNVATTLSTNPESLGLAVNEKLPAAVVSLDAAGNFSQISNVVCVERVTTTGFWDACDQNANCKDGFDKCSVSFSRDHMSWAGWSLGALGLALWLRRRRSV